jgi:hypothetical protein
MVPVEETASSARLVCLVRIAIMYAHGTGHAVETVVVTRADGVSATHGMPEHPAVPVRGVLTVQSVKPSVTGEAHAARKVDAMATHNASALKAPAEQEMRVIRALQAGLERSATSGATM